MAQSGDSETLRLLRAAYFLTNLFANVCVIRALEASDISDPVCQPLTSTFCRPEFLYYNTTVLPNFAAHASQAEADTGMARHAPLVQTRCSPLLEPLLCSVFFPKCQEFVAVGPCRSSCEAAKAACGPLLQGAGLEWPDLLACDTFPLEVVGGASPTCLKLERGASSNPAATVGAATLDGGVVQDATAAAATITTRASDQGRGGGSTSSGQSVALGNTTKPSNIEVMSPVEKEGRSTFAPSRSPPLAGCSVTAVFVGMVTSLLPGLV